MVHKLGHIADLEKLTITDSVTRDNLFEFLKVLDYEYGFDRNVDTSDGGYVLYCEDGTTMEELQSFFCYPAYTVEYVNRCLDASPPICCAMYLLNNEYAVVIVMSIADAPAEITDTFEKGY